VSKKLDETTATRIVNLFFNVGLSVSVIKRRLGVSERVIYNYIKAARTQAVAAEHPLERHLAEAA
jgi:transposase